MTVAHVDINQYFWAVTALLDWIYRSVRLMMAFKYTDIQLIPTM